MTTAAELLARTDCADLRAANEDLQRQNDILAGRVQRLNALLVLREREIDNQTAAIEEMSGDLERLRKGEIDAQQLGY